MIFINLNKIKCENCGGFLEDSFDPCVCEKAQGLNKYSFSNIEKQIEAYYGN
jgi:hypothetical protein